ncbi:MULTISPECIES: hypothetical protein [unclassified Micromonospora]|uniref:hypothetical protein n=1 Tax=unclassified Micromonospora TaxID=2617518 RepID=UPI001B39AD74|nr:MULTISPECIES: hypothetical protein [unclassified Micromonospora]MBQ1047972.1 hypothetical protein [Micromonospora sp. C51]WFE43935.1 hypothetical protein O7624_06140 [Verrucosispora sp. WMMD1129]
MFLTIIMICYVVGLVMSAVVLFAVAVTSFATTSVVDRVLAGVFSVGTAAYVWLLVRDDGAAGVFSVFFVAALFVPCYAGYKLYKGFRHRERLRMERESGKRAVAAAEDWRAVRRW